MPTHPTTRHIVQIWTKRVNTDFPFFWKFTLTDSIVTTGNHICMDNSGKFSEKNFYFPGCVLWIFLFAYVLVEFQRKKRDMVRIVCGELRGLHNPIKSIFSGSLIYAVSGMNVGSTIPVSGM